MKGEWETDGGREGLSTDRNDNGHAAALFLCTELPYMISRKSFFLLLDLRIEYTPDIKCTSSAPELKHTHPPKNKINQKADEDRPCSPAYTASWTEKNSMNSK